MVLVNDKVGTDHEDGFNRTQVCNTYIKDNKKGTF